MGRRPHVLILVALLAVLGLMVGAAALSPESSSDVANVGGDGTNPLTEVGAVESSPWDNAIETRDGGKIGVVTTGVLNVRTSPSLNATVLRSVFKRHLVPVYETVNGDEVNGESTWYRIGDNQYLASAYVEPFEPRDTETSYEGRWVDVDLSEHYAVAYVGDTPVHAAILMTGQAGWDTPEGEFEVLRRVESETMDAATVGIPKSSPNYYFLENVPYAQYFAKGGYAIHGNYWSRPGAFGGTGSHGCINMPVKDAEFFWEFLDIGSPVVIQ